jgi:putative acetyltransferase
MPVESPLSIHIRPEDTGSMAERGAIRRIHETAFGGAYEADLVDALRGTEHELVSLVAQAMGAEAEAAEARVGEAHGPILGHILFTRMWIEGRSGGAAAVALAPVAVLPGYQRKDIGRRLIEQGLDILRRRGERIVIVVGHPGYYPRFGFSTAKAALLKGPFPREALMARELVDGAMTGVEGALIYAPAFGL